MTALGALRAKAPPQRFAASWSLALLVFVGSLAAFAHLASLHRICNYRDGDFYGSYAPDAMRVAAGLFPDSVFHGPGYATALALLWPITGDLFTAGKWISVISAALAGVFAFALFRELFGGAVGLGAQLLLVSGAVFCTLATEPVTDMLFLMICLAALVVFLTPRLTPALRVAGSAALAGLAFLTRYNGVFLVATVVLAILPVNLFAKTWPQRLRLLALWGAIFLTVTAPWLYANQRHRGAALYNENYLNVAQEFYGQDFSAAPNKDGLDNIRSRFRSFGDVIRYDSMRIATRYPINLAMSIRKSLRPLPVAVCAAVGLGLVLRSRKAKGMIVLLLAGVLFLLLMGLNHFEPRYYLFVTALYAGFAALAIRAIVAWIAERMSFAKAGFAVAFASALLLIATPLGLASVRQLQRSYADEPREIFAACDYLRRRGIVNAPILARKPHLAFVCGQKDVFLPNLDSEGAMESWIRASGSAFLVIGSQEIGSRPVLASWTDPNRTPEWLRLAWSDGSLSLFEIVPAARSEETRKLVTRSWNLCDYKTDLDGQWEGSIVASDGSCYFASSTHSGRTGGMFFKFDPRTGKITVLTDDITKVCGEDPTKDAPQGKIHSDVDEMDGWLYFGTHESYSAPTRPYKGAHLVGWEMKTGKFKDFGVLEANYTNYAGLAADPKNKCVYAYLIYPGQRNDKSSFIYRVDVKTGQKRKIHEFPGMLGVMQAGGYDAAVYYMYCDPSGVLWLPTWKGLLVRYDPAKEKVELIDGVLPFKAEMPHQHWTWIQPIPGQSKAAVTCGDGLYIFDPSGEKPSFKLVARIGKTGLETAIAGNIVYYIQDLHLKAVDISKENPPVTDYGLVTDQDGRRPQRLPALAAGTDGGIYITGDWFTQGNDTATTRLNRDRKTGEETYPAQKRCERFAYVKVKPPGK